MEWNFEGQFYSQSDPQDGEGHVYVPEGVKAWWCEGGWYQELENGEVYSRPEYKPMSQFSYRIKEGSQSLRFFNTYKIHRAGIYMRAPAVAGSVYKFSSWIQVWTADAIEGNPPVSAGDPWNYGTRVGLDPLGGEDALSADVIWSDWHGRDNWDAWLNHEVSVVAKASHITCFVEARCKRSVKHNDVYIDNCILTGATPDPNPDPPPTDEDVREVLLYTADKAIEWGNGVRNILAPQTIGAKIMRKVRKFLQ